MNTSNISLKVPFNEKDQAKALGARWNAELKQWYVPEGVDSAPFKKWLSNSSTSISKKDATKASVKGNLVQDQSFDDDMDAINAKFRDAYESREFDGL